MSGKNRISDDIVERVKRNKFKILICIEVIALIFSVLKIFSKESVEYAFDGKDIKYETASTTYEQNKITQETAGENSILFTPEVKLTPGIYKINVKYTASTSDSMCEYSYHSEITDSLVKEDFRLTSDKNEQKSTIWVKHDIDFLKLIIRYGGTGDLSIDEVEIATAWNSKLYLSFCQLIFWIIIIGISVICRFWKQIANDTRYVILGIFCIVAVSTSGLFVKYYLFGHDLLYHLLRIEGLKDGFLSGQFPVRVHPNWINGWGYGAPLFYGDITLCLPAILRMIGFDIQASYKAYVLFMNALTAVLSYYSFAKISKSKYIGLSCSAIYTLSLYRLIDIYTRAAFGEYAAMTFLPLIVFGIWHALMDDIEAENYLREWVAPVIGLSGMLQTHILTCEMVAVFIAIIGVIEIKKIIRKRTLLYILEVLGFTILVNLWFLIPMVNSFGEKLYALQHGDNGIQKFGITLAELIAPFTTSNCGFYEGGSYLLGSKPSIAVGTTCILTILLYVYVSSQEKKWKYRKAACIITVLSIFSMYMATIYFPYDTLKTMSKGLAGLISKIQFPFRFLSISSVLCATLACLELMRLKKKRFRKKYIYIVTLLITVSVFQASHFIYTILLERDNAYTFYSDEQVNTLAVMGGEFLYIGSNLDITNSENNPIGNGVEVEDYTKKYNTIVMKCSTYEAENPYVEVPMFCYPGYSAYDMETKEKFPLELGDNNRIRIYLPMKYHGTVQVRYTEKGIWRVAEIISVITLIVLVIAYNKKRIWRKVKDGRNLFEEDAQIQ